MCGDIMNIWNVKSVRNTLSRLIGTVNVALMNVEQKLENYQLGSTNSLISIKNHYNAGINHLQGQILSNDTEANQRPKHSLLNELKHIKNATRINAKHGIGNMGTDAGTITQDILTEKQSVKSSTNLAISVLNVKLRQLRLTTLSRYQKAVQITLITYNHYANPATQRKVTDESYL